MLFGSDGTIQSPSCKRRVKYGQGLLAAALEAGRGLAVAAAVERDSRVLTYKPDANLFAVLEVADLQLIGHDVVFLPLLDERQGVEAEVLGTASTGTMPHPRHHEEAHRFARLPFSNGRHDAIEVVDRD